MIIEEKCDEETSFVYDGKNSYLKKTIIQPNGMISETFLNMDNVPVININHAKCLKKFEERVVRHKKLEKLLC